MQDFHLKSGDLDIEISKHDEEQATARWTSPIYAVKFGQVEHIPYYPDEQDAFQMSAWGVSAVLRELLADYSDTQIRSSAEWLTLQQNQVVGEMLVMSQMEQQILNDKMAPLETMFFVVDSELYLPRGLRMQVACITNIVPLGEPDYGLDKFVAIVDPGEVSTYIAERRTQGMAWHTSWLH